MPDYKIDNKTVTFEEYAREVETVWYPRQSEEFFGFQGDIEAVAQKSPKDLTQLFEQLSEATS